MLRIEMFNDNNILFYLYSIIYESRRYIIVYNDMIVAAFSHFKGEMGGLLYSKNEIKLEYTDQDKSLLNPQ